jgi:hypothetical protein
VPAGPRWSRTGPSPGPPRSGGAGPAAPSPTGVAGPGLPALRSACPTPASTPARETAPPRARSTPRRVRAAPASASAPRQCFPPRHRPARTAGTGSARPGDPG